MELRQFFDIFCIHKKMFWGIIFVSVAVGILLFLIQPTVYKTSIMLNVTRDSVQDVNEYIYDDFYRLQADERFADTVVQWILSPYINTEVFGASGNNSIIARRMSSQVIDVSYKTDTIEEGREYAQKLVSTVNIESQRLNQIQLKEGWFIVLGSNPVIVDATYPFYFILGIFSFIGFFIAFWMVMIIHYFLGNNIKK